jgi:hypothetical protein
VKVHQVGFNFNFNLYKMHGEYNIKYKDDLILYLIFFGHLNVIFIITVKFYLNMDAKNNNCLSDN